MTSHIRIHAHEVEQKKLENAFGACKNCAIRVDSDKAEVYVVGFHVCVKVKCGAKNEFIFAKHELSSPEECSVRKRAENRERHERRKKRIRSTTASK